MLKIFIDGSSKGNPGPSASAYVITDEKEKVLAKKAHFLKEATNNYAEYYALLKSLEKAQEIIQKENLLSVVEITTDSELVAKQFRGEYRAKSKSIIPLLIKARQIANKFDKVEIKWVSRLRNKLADQLANAALALESDVDEV